MSKIFVSPFQKIKFPGIGIILASLSCITYCGQCVLVKRVPDFSKQAILIHRGIYTAVICVPIILHGGHSFFPKTLGQYLIICTRGIIGTLASVFMYKSLDILPLIDATVLAKTDLIFTAVLGFLILREKVHLIDVITITLSMVGIILITRPSFIFEDWDNKLNAQSRILGSLLAVGYGLFVSLANILVRQITCLHYAVTIFHHFVIQTLILYGYHFILDETIFPECGTVPLIILGIGLFSFGTHYFHVNALYMEKASCVALVSSLEIVFSFIFQVTITGEELTLLSVLGALFIMLAVTMKACLQWYSESPERFLKAWNKIGLRCFRSGIVASTPLPLQEL